MKLALSKRRLWLAALVVLLAIPLTILLSRFLGGFVRDVVAVPILYLVWVVRLYVDAVPQVLFWGALLIFGLALAATSFLVGVSGSGMDRRKTRDAAASGRGYTSQVHQLTSQIRYAARSAYFRRHLAQRLGRLMVRHLDYGERYRPAQVEQALDALDAPPEIRVFLLVEGQLISSSRSAGLIAWLKRRLWRGEEAAAPSLNLERVVRFLEDRLEV